MHTVIVGCGYVGVALAHLWQGFDLTLTTTTPARVGELQAYGRVVAVDSSDEKKMAEVLADAERIVVCVAPKSGDYSVYTKTAQTIVKVMPKKAHLVWTSSSSVYGDHQGEWVTEESELKGNTTLIETEKIYMQLPHVTILRLSGIYGPGRELENFAQRVSGTEQNDSYTNWVHVNDIVRAIDFAFEQNLQGIYNLSNDEHPKRSELYIPLLHKMGLEPAIWKEGPTFFGNKRVSNAKIKQAGFIFYEKWSE